MTYIEVGDHMKCLRCGNQDNKYFYNDKGVYYCRKCIMFGRIDVGTMGPIRKYRKKQHSCKYHLPFSLTIYQDKVVIQLNTYLHQHQNTLVYAAPGAGKTEIVMQSIQEYLNAGKKVGFAISRRQVVLEIAKRLQEAFTVDVVAVCEGYTRIVDGDIIVCTMHQLYRYTHTFDLLIMDEVDAFPYYQNKMLETIAMHACIGEIIYLTATPDNQMKEAIKKDELKVVELFRRPHGYPLVVPDVKLMPKWLQYINLYYFLKRKQLEKKKVLVFVPTIQLTIYLSKIFSFWFSVAAFSSKTMEKEKCIHDFTHLNIHVLFCTTVLERGITIKGVDVCVVEANHIVFNEASLIQIFGRIGRSVQIPTGEGLLLCSKKNKEIKNCISTIQRMNTNSFSKDSKKQN